MRSETITTIEYNVEAIRADFPILHRNVHGKPLVYLDNAASTQKPLVVINTLDNYYKESNSNIHRGVHYLSQVATKQYDDARVTVQKFLGAKRNEEIIFTRGTTESINLVASSWGRKNLKEGDEVIISYMEHHSNIVPWQLICEERGAKLKVIPINDDGEIIFEEYEQLLSDRTKFVSIVHVSNSLGTINPIKAIIEKAHERGIPVMIDAAQSVQHLKVNVQDLDCEFLALSGHKIFGPTGIGALYGKKEMLDAMPPYHGGGDMIESVRFEKTTYAELPAKFEAGTPHIAGAIGLAAAIDYLEGIGLEKIAAYEHSLLEYGTKLLSEIDGLRLIGTAREKTSVLSFVLDNVHPHDIGTFLDMDGVAVRTGQHCTEPVMHRFNVPATTRASIALYNKKEDLDVLAESVKNVIKIFR